MTYTTRQLEDILSPLSPQRIGDTPRQFSLLLTDTRSLRDPSDTLFFALTTPLGDGHRYVPLAQRRGVRVFVLSHLPDEVLPDAVYFLVPSPLEALQTLAAHHRSLFPHIPLLAIAGSNGKTTVKEWLYQMLSPEGNVITRSPRSYNSQIGVPLSLWQLEASTQIGIFEAAISRPGEMQALQRMIRPTLGVFTSLGDAHQENFPSMEAKCQEKLKLFTDVDTLVWAQGNPTLDKCINQLADSSPRPIHLVPVPSAGLSPIETNRSLCQAVCQQLGMAPDTANQRAASLNPIPMRLEVMQALRGSVLINDTYNSDLASLDTALLYMERHSPAPLPHLSHTDSPTPPIASTPRPLRRILILSDILQTGLPPKELYTHVARLIASRGITQLFAVGPTITAHASLLSTIEGLTLHLYPSTEALLHSHALDSIRDSLILLKGARPFRFELIAHQLKARQHQTTLHVNLTAITRNLHRYRTHLLRPHHTRIACMVKADAYGLGAVEVSRALEDAGVDYLCVALADEGVRLREAGITTPIIVMNPEASSLDTLFAYHLEPEAYSLSLVNALIREATRQGITRYPIHLKVDTGMHRLGFSPQPHAMLPLIQTLRSQTALTPRSIFSHLAAADTPEEDDFTNSQIALLNQAADQLDEAFPEQPPIIRHIANTIATTRLPHAQLDMVRLGIGLYEDTATLRTVILQTHHVPQGESVGYSRRWIAPRASLIASIPVGYADGLNRELSRRGGYAMANGQAAPYVGNVCMDVAMIDVTAITPRPKEGDSVEILGQGIPPTKMAAWTDTISYEVLTSISHRIPRIHIRE